MLIKPSYIFVDSSKSTVSQEISDIHRLSRNYFAQKLFMIVKVIGCVTGSGCHIESGIESTISPSNVFWCSISPAQSIKTTSNDHQSNFWWRIPDNAILFSMDRILHTFDALRVSLAEARSTVSAVKSFWVFLKASYWTHLRGVQTKRAFSEKCRC